jgi:hypothetical protein
MKSIILALTSFAALTLAQSEAATASPPAPTLTPVQQCLAKCAAGDVNCQAICVGVPHPGEVQVNLTNQCVAACDQGDGSAAASNRYAECRNACIASYIITSGTAAPGGAYTTKYAPGQSSPSAVVSQVTKSAGASANASSSKLGF